MSGSTRIRADLDRGRALARSRHVDAGVVTEMARALRREARRTREGGASLDLDTGRAIEAARLRHGARGRPGSRAAGELPGVRRQALLI